jgi:vitamin B12 transporter
MNSESATLKGVELEAGWQHSGWEVAAAVSAGDFEDETTGNHLPYRAEQTAKLDLDKNFQRFYLGTTLRAENHRYDIDGTSRLPGYGAWDLRAGFDLAKNWSARVNVDNVLDKERRGGDYQNSYYVTPGRTFMLSVRYDFQP